MGLDMYLIRVPRYGDTTIEQICSIESYLDWQDARKRGKEIALNSTFEKWCGIKIEDLPTIDIVDFYRTFYKKRYAAWDTAKQYGHKAISHELGYWRKANHIHRWFVENVQDGIDDCQYHNEVTKMDLENLLDICEHVLKHSKLGEEEDGTKYVKNSSIAEKLLPTESGFFFGSTVYDEWYISDIKETIKVCKKALRTTDFDTQMIYYCSSW